MSTSHTADILIIGSGAAGLTAALNLADRFKVTVLAKGALNEGATAWAQDGVAAVLGAVQREEYSIVDVSTREADLEDVFLNLTRAANG